MAHHKLLCLLSYRSFNLIIMEVAQRLGQKVSFESCLKEWITLEKDFEQCQVSINMFINKFFINSL